MISTENKKIIVRHLFDYMAEAGYLLAIENEPFKKTLYEKVMELKNDHVFEECNSNTKTFIYALSGIQF